MEPSAFVTKRCRASLGLCALLIAACASGPVVVEPVCKSPAPLYGKYDRTAPGYLIALDAATTESAIERLRATYGLQQPWNSMTRLVFAEHLTPTTIASLRCEPEVRSVNYNATLHKVIT